MSTAFRLISGAVLSLAVVATPVAARDYHGNRHHYSHRHNNGIGVGGVLLGAAIIGGVAAIASSNRNRYDRGYGGYNQGYGNQGYGGYDQGYGGYSQGYGNQGYGGYGNQSHGAYDQGYAGYDQGSGYGGGVDPVQACARAAERQAQWRGGYARVTGIDRVDPYNGGSVVRGSVEIDRGGYAQRLRFSCTANYEGAARVRLG